MPIVYLAIFASSVAFVLYANAVSIIGVTRTNTFTNLIPVLTTIFAFFLRDEIISPAKATGIAVVVGGLFLSQLQPTFIYSVFEKMRLITRAIIKK